MSYPPASRAWYTIFVLSVIYLFSFMDRQILVLLVEPIKHDLQINDVQMSLLTGTAFAVLYSIVGVPLGWAADRYSRKWVIGTGVALWSALTIGCGTAKSFMQMFFLRMGIGIGEAALTPTALGMIPDLVPPEKRARAMSIFIMSAYFGGGAALIFGGFVVQAANAFPGSVKLPLFGLLKAWQFVLVLVGAATLLMLVPILTITDPKRGHSDKAILTNLESRSIRQTVDYIWENRAAFTPVMIGVTLLNLFEYGAAAWVPSYLIRNFHLDAGHVGYLVGSISMVFGVGSVLIAGAVADKMRAAGDFNAHLRVILYSLPIAWLGLFVFTRAHSVTVGLAGYAMLMSGQVVCGPLGPAALQSITLGGMRAKVAAIWLLVANLVGIGFGPTAVALVTDYYFKDATKVGTSLLYIGTMSFVAAGILIATFSRAHADLAMRCEPATRRAASDRKKPNCNPGPRIA
jgi:MFS family permease